LYGQRVTVRAWVEEVRSRTVKICYEIVETESGQSLVVGHTRHVCIDVDGKVVRIPALWREFFSG
jgi:acyl-CoA thioester hydrolase